MLAKNPSSYVFVSMASECARAGKNKMALAVLEKGLTFHPTLGSALTMKGRVLASLGRATEARDILTRVADSDPDNLLARRILSGLPNANGFEAHHAEDYEPTELEHHLLEELKSAPFHSLFDQPQDAVEEEARVEQAIAVAEELPPAPVAEEPEIAVFAEEEQDASVPTEAMITAEAEQVYETGAVAEAAPTESETENAADVAAETEKEPEAAPTHDTRAVETLEKWLNNATKMMRG
jgi:hypothetical protein